MDDRDDEAGEGPLKAEALAREEWRGHEDGMTEQGDAPGHMLPESERGPPQGDGEERKGSGALSTILPPD